MFKLLAAAFLGASSVLASNVPVFSANDDYDEVNLNIRLLAAHNVTDPKKAYKVQGSFKASFTFPEGTTAATLNEDTAFKSGLETAISGAIDGVDASMTKVDKIEDASAARQLEEARRLATVTLVLKVLYTITFATADAATAAAALIDTSASSSFMSALTTGLAVAATAAGATFDATSLTAEAPTVVTPAPEAGSSAATEAPAAAAPAPAAASSSDATMLKANMAVAAVAALVASIFA